MADGSGKLSLIVGASGYIGGRLLAALEGRGDRVRCLARRPDYLRERIGAGTEVVGGDVLDFSSLGPALSGVHTAFYLVHSMMGGGSFEEKDRAAAENFARAAREAGVSKIVYLGGLGHGEDLSSHLASRQEVGRILRESGVPTVEFRASVIIGSGSLSFEMVRSLVERLPVMITPRWVRTLCQPIAVEDVIIYLVEALDMDFSASAVFEIGGADRISYGGIMQEYARQRGLKRLMIPVPFLTPHFSSMWLGLVTPLYRKVGRKLIEGVRNETTVRDDAALRVFRARPRGIEWAVRRALHKEDQAFTQTHWSDALEASSYGQHWTGAGFGRRLLDSYSLHLPYPPCVVFEPIQCVGGDNGWYAFDWLWQLRGRLDRLVGGVGLRRGRRDACNVRPGDAIDFWRVEAYEQDRFLLLYAEMKVPGRAWLQFEVDPDADGSRLRMTAIFDPLGLWGRVYWYSMYPFHFLIFNGMFKGILRAVDRRGREC